MEGRDPVFAEVSENFVLKRLQERVWRLESENKDLREKNELLALQHSNDRELKQDMFKNLQEVTQDHEDRMTTQDKTIQRLEQQVQDQQTEFESRLEAEKRQWESQVLGKQKMVDELEEKLNKVEVFRREKDNMEAELDRLKNELQEQADSHAKDVSAFDRKKAMEIDQLKKDMHRKVREMREMLRAKTKDQLDQTTKRTIMENEQMVTELHFQNKESERLLNSNNALLEENAQLRRNLAIHKDLENELARRTHVYQKLIKKMQEREQAEIAARESPNQSRELRMSGGEDRGLDDISRELPSAVFSSEETERIRKQLESAQSSLAVVRHEFAQYRRDHNTLTQLQDQSTRLIISALYELKNQRECDPFPPASYDENAEWQFANMTGKQKEYFFRVLLEKLNSSMCGTCFPTGSGGVPAGVSEDPSSASLLGGPCQHSHGAAAGDPTGHSHLSQFLWSVATHGGMPTGSAGGGGGREMASKSIQTETNVSDPCFREGLWNPTSRKAFGTGALTPRVVGGDVRPWGIKSVTPRRR